MEPPSLDAARAELVTARARLRRLRRGAAPGRPAEPGPAAGWTRLRRGLERLRDLLGSWSADVEGRGGPPDPEHLRRKNELDARALRVETALRELEEKQERLEEARERTLAELERIQEGWRLLRESRPGPGGPVDESRLSALLAKVHDLAGTWEAAAARQDEAAREADRAERVWRWIVASAWPGLEAKAAQADPTFTVPTIGRLVSDIDRRWKAARRRWAGRPLPAEPGESQESPEAREARLAAEAALESKDNRLALLAGEVEWLRRSLEESRDDKVWKELLEKARAENQSLLAALSRSEAKREALAHRLDQNEADAALRADASDKRLAQERGAGRLRESGLEARLGEALAALSKAGHDPALAEAARLGAELEGARAQAAALQERLDSQIRGLSAHFEADARKNAELDTRLESARAQWRRSEDAYARELSTLRVELEAAQERERGLSESLEAERADPRLPALEARAAELTGARDELENLLFRARGEADGFRMALEEEAGRRAREVEVLAMQKKAELDAAERSEAALLARLEEGRLKAASLEAERKNLAKRVEELERGLAARDAALANSKLEGEVLDKARQAALKKLALAQREAMAQTAGARQELDILKARQAALASELKKARKPPEAPVGPWGPSLPEAGLLKTMESLADSLAAARKALGPAARGARQKLSESLDRARALAEFLTPAAAAPAEVNVELVLAEVLNQWDAALKARGIRLVRDFDRGLPPALAHAPGLRSAAYQAVRNAAEALPRGGRLTVRLSYQARHGRLIVDVADTGAGFSAEALVRAGEPLYSAKPGHLGLGLALARRALRKFGADWEASNGASGGGVLSLRLPVRA